MAQKNLAGKSRKSENAYAAWTDPRSGWKYKLLKSWQADNSKEYARWHVEVYGFGHDMGDEYVANLLKGVNFSQDLTFDKSIWPERTVFLAWANGSQVI